MNFATDNKRLTMISLLIIVLSVFLFAGVCAEDSPYVIRLDTLPDQFLGHDVIIGATLAASDTVHGLTGFDLTIAYYQDVMSFLDAFPGEIVADRDWEYFTYELQEIGGCDSDCPVGLLHIAGSANPMGGQGSRHPHDPVAGGAPETLFTMKFLLTTDHDYDRATLPIRWYWTDCEDNRILTADPAEQIISSRVLEPGPEGVIDIADSSVGFPTYQGAQTSCSTPSEGYVTGGIDFYNSVLQIVWYDTVDARGDLNDNQIPNELGDYLIYTSYFMQGLSAFTIDLRWQIAASDINADGIQLHIADLLYLSRVIQGDALPFPKYSSFNSTGQATFSVSSDTLSLQTTEPLGAVYLKFPGEVVPSLLQIYASVQYNFDNTNTNVLILGSDPLLPSYLQNGPLLSIVPQSLSGRSLPILAQASDTLGFYINAIINSPTGVGDGPNDNLPTQFSLDQNYPNPFNPTTTISFTLPRAGDYTLTIFNLLGQSVQTFTGHAPAGSVSVIWDAGEQPSGVYLYRLQAGDRSDGRKMLLLK